MMEQFVPVFHTTPIPIDGSSKPKPANLREKAFAAYRRVLSDYAQVSVPVSVNCPTGRTFQQLRREPTPQPPSGWSLLVRASSVPDAREGPALCELPSHALCSATLDRLAPRIFWSILLS
jgi:hypothetical protein